jgi:hypothetical protein
LFYGEQFVYAVKIGRFITILAPVGRIEFVE